MSGDGVSTTLARRIGASLMGAAAAIPLLAAIFTLLLVSTFVAYSGERAGRAYVLPRLVGIVVLLLARIGPHLARSNVPHAVVPWLKRAPLLVAGGLLLEGLLAWPAVNGPWHLLAGLYSIGIVLVITLLRGESSLPAGWPRRLRARWARFTLATLLVLGLIELELPQCFLGALRLDPHAVYRFVPTARYSINEHGFRGTSPRGEANTPDFRILALGDSSTAGFGLAEANSYPRVLESILDEHCGPSFSVEVVNAGVPTYSLYQALAAFRHDGESLEPDLVLLYFGYLSMSPQALSFEARFDRWEQEIYEAPGRLARWSRAAAAFGIIRLKRAFNEPPPGMDPNATVTETPEEFAHLVREFAASGEERGFRLALFEYPYLDPVVPGGPDMRSSPYLETVRTLSRELDVPLVPAVEVLSHLDTVAYFRDEVHPNVQGARLIAELAADTLIASGAVPCDAPDERPGEILPHPLGPD